MTSAVFIKLINDFHSEVTGMKTYLVDGIPNRRVLMVEKIDLLVMITKMKAKINMELLKEEAEREELKRTA